MEGMTERWRAEVRKRGGKGKSHRGEKRERERELKQASNPPPPQILSSIYSAIRSYNHISNGGRTGQPRGR